jgi:hypothetical protein
VRIRCIEALRGWVASEFGARWDEFTYPAVSVLSAFQQDHADGKNHGQGNIVHLSWASPTGEEAPVELLHAQWRWILFVWPKRHGYISLILLREKHW